MRLVASYRQGEIWQILFLLCIATWSLTQSQTVLCTQEERTVWEWECEKQFGNETISWPIWQSYLLISTEVATSHQFLLMWLPLEWQIPQYTEKPLNNMISRSIMSMYHYVSHNLIKTVILWQIPRQTLMRIDFFPVCVFVCLFYWFHWIWNIYL